MIKIKHIEVHRTSFASEVYPTAYCMPRDVGELEANYQEVIEYMFRLIKNSMAYYDDMIYGLSQREIEEHYDEGIAIIEKATGKSWEELTK